MDNVGPGRRGPGRPVFRRSLVCPRGAQFHFSNGFPLAVRRRSIDIQVTNPLPILPRFPVLAGKEKYRPGSKNNEISSNKNGGAGNLFR